MLVTLGRPSKAHMFAIGNHAYTIPANATSKSIQYEALDLNLQSGYCFEDHGYPLTALLDQTRCLPDTANPSYSWGFSTMLSAIFVFIHLAWCVTMWIVWVDAQVYSTLVKSGYEMSPLRAAFAMAQSASWKTGLSAGQLVRADATEVQQECYGVKGGTTGVEIGAELFRKEDIQGAEDRDRDLRRRTRRQEKDNVSVETRRIVT